jgi:hypothetical protein
VQVVVDDGLSLLDRRQVHEDARAQARGHGQQAAGLQVRVQVGGRVAGGLGGSQLGGDHVDHGVGVLDERRDRQRRIGQGKRQVGRVEDGEGAAFVVGGQRLGQDGGDDVARACRAA